MKARQGEILVIVLVMLALLLVMLLAGSRLIATQYHATVVQENRELLYYVAEAGGRYAIWLLNVAHVPVNQLVTNPPPPQTITHPTTGQALGVFTDTFSATTIGRVTTVTVTAVGTSAINPGASQTITVVLTTTDDVTFTVQSWDQKF